LYARSCPALAIGRRDAHQEIDHALRQIDAIRRVEDKRAVRAAGVNVQRLGRIGDIESSCLTSIAQPASRRNPTALNAKALRRKRLHYAFAP
jgi:hypothetical protein